MNLDSLARASAADLHHAVARTVDTDGLYASLSRLRSRRRHERLVALTAVVVAVVVLVMLPRAGGTRSLPAVPPSPTTPRLSSSVVAVTDRGLVTTGPTAEPATLPGLAPGERLRSLAFSSDAKRLAYAVGGRLHVRELASGADRVVATCSAVCPAAWASDGTTLVTSRDGRTLTVLTASGHTVQTIALPPNWGGVSSLDVSKHDLVVMAGSLGWQGAILSVGLDGSDPRVVLDLSGNTLVPGARWSPDGERVLFLQYEKPAPASVESDLSLRSVRLDGAEGRMEAEVGLCRCVSQLPGLDVSENGEVVLGALLVGARGEPAPVLGLYSGGRLWPQDAQASAPVAFLPR